MKYTVLGATGLIGSHVAALARQQGHEVFCPDRNAPLEGLDLGHVIYSIGVTADFRRRPHDTVTAHVTKLQQVLTRTTFDTLVYLSSTRVYARCEGLPAREDAPLAVLSSDFSDLYNLSKLMGESLALAHGPNVKVARLSNVVGPDFDSENFLMSVLRDGVRHGRVEVRTSRDSVKDYIAIEDVASVLLRLGCEGRLSMYNVASGRQTTHAEVASVVARCTGADVSFAPDSPTVRFPRIEIGRLASEFDFVPRTLDAILPPLASEFQRRLSSGAFKDAA